MTPLAEELDGSDAEKMAPMFLSPCDWLVTSIQTSCLELKSLVQRWTVVICDQHK